MMNSMKIQESVNSSSKQEKSKGLQVRIMGPEREMELLEELLVDCEQKGECQLGHFSRLLDIKTSDVFKRKFVSVEMKDENMEED